MASNHGNLNRDIIGNRKVIFSDDFHHTQTLQKAFAEFLIKFMLPFKSA